MGPVPREMGKKGGGGRDGEMDGAKQVNGREDTAGPVTLVCVQCALDCPPRPFPSTGQSIPSQGGKGRAEKGIMRTTTTIRVR